MTGIRWHLCPSDAGGAAVVMSASLEVGSAVVRGEVEIADGRGRGCGVMWPRQEQEWQDIVGRGGRHTECVELGGVLRREAVDGVV